MKVDISRMGITSYGYGGGTGVGWNVGGSGYRGSIRANTPMR